MPWYIRRQQPYAEEGTSRAGKGTSRAGKGTLRRERKPMQSLTGTLKTRRVSTNLVRLKHAVEPRQELLRAVVGVQHHRDAVELGHLSHVQGHGYGPGDGRLLLGLLVVDAFAGEESGAAVRHAIPYFR